MRNYLHDAAAIATLLALAVTFYTHPQPDLPTGTPATSGDALSGAMMRGDDQTYRMTDAAITARRGAFFLSRKRPDVVRLFWAVACFKPGARRRPPTSPPV
jgi:hypothetical protein